MDTLLPVIRCGHCTERILILEDNISLLQKIVEILLILKNHDQSPDKGVFGNIGVELKFLRCQACGQERKIEKDELEILAEVLAAFAYQRRPKVKSFMRGAWC